MGMDSKLIVSMVLIALNAIALRKNFMKIKLYTIKGCSNCLLVKKFFDKMKVEYETIDCDENLEESIQVMKEAKSEQLPIVKYTTDSDSYIIGYDKENLDKLFNLTN